MISWEIEELDREIGKIKKHSLILIHEEDASSRGKDILFYILSRKLKSDNLVGMFSISYPLQLIIRIISRFGVDVIKYLENHRLAIVDTFGSFHGIKATMPGVWYLEGMLSSETLPIKYAKAVEDHKKVWMDLNLFEGRELYGFAISMSGYLEVFTPEETLRYLETSAEVRYGHPAYKKYPRGTNFWLWEGVKDKRVLLSVYRRADYVLKTRSSLGENGIKRELLVIKTPKPIEELVRFEYEFKGNEPKLRRVD